MEEIPKRPASDPPTQFGSTTAVSTSADNLRPEEVTSLPSQTEQMPALPARSNETIILPAGLPQRSDETVIISDAERAQGAATRAERAGAWGDNNPELEP